MNFKSFGKIAGVSAIAMVAALHVAGVNTAVAQYVIGTDIPVPFSATVDNTITVAVTAANFGTLAAMNSDAGDTASATMSPSATPVMTDAHSTGFGTTQQAHIVFDDASPITPVAALVEISNAFINEEMYVTFGACTDLTLGGSGTGAALLLDDITTDLPASVTYDCSTPLVTGNEVTIDNTGAASFYIGASIETDGTTDAAYDDGVYSGAVQMQITY